MSEREKLEAFIMSLTEEEADKLLEHMPAILAELEQMKAA